MIHPNITGYPLAGKIALVVGASRGTNQAIGRALARAGADLAITSRKKWAVAEFQNEVETLGRRALPVEVDLTKAESIHQMVAAVRREYGRIDVLVNAPGVNLRKPAIEVKWADWNTVLDTALKSSFFCSTAVAPGMIERGFGRIINIGSPAAVMSVEGQVPYSASHGALVQMTRSLAAEWGPAGITVNIIAPGWLRTARNSALEDAEEWLSSESERVPLGHPGKPQDLYGAVVFLASDASAYVTGQVIHVDGGFTTGAIRSFIPD